MAINSASRSRLSAGLLVFRLAQFTKPEAILECFDRHYLIVIDAHVDGDLHRLFGDLARRKLRVLGKSLGSSLSERASAADSGNTPIGFNHITLATQQERL